MRSILPMVIVVGAVAAPRAPAQQPVAPQAAPAAAAVLAPALDSARGAMRAGRVEDAVRYAERYSSRNPRDPRGYVTLGDAYMRRPSAGRFSALRAYEEAMRLSPGDPEPPYLYAQAGVFIGGDEGEAIARRGLERALSFDPLFRDAWDLWQMAFRDEDARRAMRGILAPHAERPEVRGRLAQLHLEDERYREADSLLDGLLALDSTRVEWLALRAQSAYEAGDTARGGRFYARALANARHDSTGALWRQAVGIARPEEVRGYEAVPAAGRGAWLELFWVRRSPDLFAGPAGRVAEHFARFRHARRAYPLERPLVAFHRSRLGRALSLEPTRGEREFHRRCEASGALARPPAPPPVRTSAAADTPYILGEPATAPAGARERRAGRGDPAPPAPGPAGALSDAEADALHVPLTFRAAFAALNLELRAVDTAAARIGFNLLTGLDDRGLLYLRFGPPERLSFGGRADADASCRTLDVERWHQPGIGEVRFARPDAFDTERRPVGMVFRPMDARQAEAMAAGLALDAPSLAAPLPFEVWTAQFAAGRPGAANVAVIATRGRLAGVLASPEHGAGDLRRGEGGVVVLEAAPGSYLLEAHARDASGLGRRHLGIAVRSFLRRPGLSDLLLAPAWPAPGATFVDMLRRVRRDLVFPAGGAIRSYAEVYGLDAMAGAVRYRADYLLLPTDDVRRDAAREEWPAALRLSFERVAEAAPVVREVLDLPNDLAPGAWLLRLTVTDLAGGEVAGRATIGFVVR